MDKVTWYNRILVLRHWRCLYRAPEPMARTRGFWLAIGCVTLAVIAFSVFFIIYLTSRQAAFQTNAEDFGIMDQAIWSTVHGQFLHQTICNVISDTNCYSQQGIIRFALHFEPILLPISLLYFIWSDPRILLILQTLVVASGAYPAFWLARLRLRNEWAGVAIALIYLLYPAQQQATTFDFHAVTLTAALLLFVLYFLYTRQTLWLFVFAFLAMACKEEISLTIALIGIWSIVFQLRWRSGLMLCLLGGIWFGLAFYIIMPHFSPTGHPLLLPRFEASGGLLSYFLNGLRHPISFVQQNVLEKNHLLYLHDLFSPAGYVPLGRFSIFYLLFLAPWMLVLALPAITINLISGDPQMYSGLFQYNAEIVPIIIFSLIEALVVLLWCVKMVLLWVHRRSGSWKLKKFAPALFWLTDQSIRTIFLTATLLLILFSTLHSDYYFHGQMPFSIGFSWPGISVHNTDAQSMLNLIPADASVSAQTRLVPHVSQRKNIYLFPYQDEQADYLFLDVTGDIYPYNDSTTYTNEVKRILLNGHYDVLKASNGYLLLKHRLPASEASSQAVQPPAYDNGTPTPSSDLQPSKKLIPFSLPTSFCSNIYVTPGQVTHALQANFTDGDGEVMSLIGFATSASGQVSRTNGYISVTTYWRVPATFSENFQILYIIDGSSGQEYLASTDAPSLLWCPSASWKPGAIVQISSRVFSLQTRDVPKGLAHMSIALLPQVQSSSTIMNVQARLSLRIVNAPDTVSTDPKTNVLRLLPLKIVD